MPYTIMQPLGSAPAYAELRHEDCFATEKVP